MKGAKIEMTDLTTGSNAAQEVLEAPVGARGLFQLCVFRLGFLQDGDVGVGVFPEGEEILVGGAGFGEGVKL
jgi:hypothetical protein